MRTALIVGIAAALLALAGCSSGAVENAATTSASSAGPTTSTTPPKTHQITYSYVASGANGLVEATVTYIGAGGAQIKKTIQPPLSMLETVDVPEGVIAMVSGEDTGGQAGALCSIELDGRTVVEQRSDVRTGKGIICSYIVH